MNSYKRSRRFSSQPVAVRCLALGGLVLAVCGCEGLLTGTGQNSESGAAGGGASDTSATEDGANSTSNHNHLPDLASLDCDSIETDPGESLIRLLYRPEYLNTLEELFGDLVGVEETLPTYIPPSSLGVPQAPVTANEVESLHRAAEVIAAQVVAQPALMDAIAPCGADEQPLACARLFVENFVARAYRSPVTDEEDIAAHLALFEVGLTESYVRGIELLLRGVVQSPRFLYQVEIGTSDLVGTTAVQLRPYELAARLSYTVWEGPPDVALLNAADAGELATEDGLTRQLERLLNDPRGHRFQSRFLAALTHLERLPSREKNPELFPDWEQLREPLRDQAWAFFDHMMHSEEGTLSGLLTTDTVMVNDQLAPYYGLTAAPGWEARQAPEGTASGLLTLPAMLAVLAKASEGSPIFRGVFIREAFLCQSPPAPPDEIPPAPEVDSSASTRERLAQHVSEPACAGCHSLIDPVGLGFEHYDAMGMYRELDAGKPVDASGELLETDVDGVFNGAVELGQRLSESAEVEQCFTQQWFRYVTRRIESESDACSIKSLLTDFQGAGQDLRQLASAMVRTDAFRYRRPSDAEVTP